MRALRTKLRRSVPNGRPDSRYTNLIVQLKDLENINRIHMHYIDWLRSSWSIIRLPTLFSEIFDIPISSKSSTSSAISESFGEDSLVNDFEEPTAEESIRRDHILAEGDDRLQSSSNSNKSQHHQLFDHQQDSFFSLANFQDTDDKIDAADLNPTVDCLDVVDQLTSQ